MERLLEKLVRLLAEVIIEGLEAFKTDDWDEFERKRKQLNKIKKLLNEVKK